MAIPPIPKEIGDTLHARLISGCDPHVTREIAETFLPRLILYLKTRFRGLRDPHWIPQIAADTILHYFESPQRYDPTNGELASYLCMDARRDLLNLLEKDRRNERKLVQFDAPDSEEVHEKPKAESNPESLLLDEESPLLKRVLALVTDPLDQELVRLMMDGARRTEEFAALLGIQDQSAGEQRAIVNRHKARLRKLLRRRIKVENSG